MSVQSECKYCRKLFTDPEQYAEHMADCDARFLQWYEQRNERPDEDPGEAQEYDGPDEAQEWHDFDPDA